MNECFISKTSLLAYGAWLVAAALFIGSWYIAIFHRDWWLWAGMLAATALGFTAIAAVAHFRLYMVRTCTLIRTLAGLRESDGGQLRSMR